MLCIPRNNCRNTVYCSWSIFQHEDILAIFVLFSETVLGYICPLSSTRRKMIQNGVLVKKGNRQSPDVWMVLVPQPWFSHSLWLLGLLGAFAGQWILMLFRKGMTKSSITWNTCLGNLLYQWNLKCSDMKPEWFLLFKEFKGLNSVASLSDG